MLLKFQSFQKRYRGVGWLFLGDEKTKREMRKNVDDSKNNWMMKKLRQQRALISNKCFVPLRVSIQIISRTQNKQAN